MAGAPIGSENHLLQGCFVRVFPGIRVHFTAILVVTLFVATDTRKETSPQLCQVCIPWSLLRGP